MHKFFIELVKHSSENDGDCEPLESVYIMVEDEDTENDCENFSCCGYEREYVLFKVCHNVIDADLSYDL